MNQDISIIRLYLIRLMFLLNFVMLGSDVWPAIFDRANEWDSVQAVAYSFWATLSALSLLGIRYPLKMLPLLFTQFTYKFIWLAVVAVPRYPEIQTDGLFWIMSIGLLVDVVVIPWSYVIKNYIKAKGNRWR